ncbi:bifunctional phosphoribosylaminoimidazolecarboxamide formyltransferase/IMP cyclohydrolase PurH, partial [candidate division WOR-3 bacterium]|nr:bifunctional phosphoribosylaminoimidazolecarboxamide formyltransferase/IMP cyclohydrolase PurH [candidate division WOR-3 bacterium]
LRAAAKNHAFVTVVPDPKFYPAVIAELGMTGSVSADMRKKLAAEAFAATSRYDTAIARYFQTVTR